MPENNGEGNKAPIVQKEEPKEEKNPAGKIMDEILGKDKKGNKAPRKSFL